MYLAHVNAKFLVQSTTSATISISYTPAQNGNLIVVSFVDGVTSGHAVSIADTNGNVWLTAVPQLLTTFDSSIMFYCQNCRQDTTTITVTTSSTNFRAIYISEFSGQDPNNALDQAVSNTATSSNWTSTAKTTTIAMEIIYGLAQTGSSQVPDASFNIDNDDRASDANSTVWKIVNSVGSYAVFGTSTNSAYGVLMATFIQGPVVMLGRLGP